MHPISRRSFLAAGAAVLWKLEHLTVPVIAPPVVARVMERAVPKAKVPPHERVTKPRNVRHTVPRPDPALEAALQAFLAKEKAAETPDFPPEKGTRIETGDPNIVLILISADSGGTHE